MNPDSTPPPPPSPAAGPDPAAAGAGGGAPPFQVLRSRQDRRVGGVAGGLAAAAGLDATLVRFAVALGFLTGWGVLAYLIAWAAIPEEDSARGRHLVPAPEPAARYLRIGLSVLGVLGLLHVLGAVLGVVSTAILGIGLLPFHVLGFGGNPGFEFGEAVLGLVLVVGGLVVLFRRRVPGDPPAASGAPDAGGPAGPAAGSAASGAGGNPGSPPPWTPPAPIAVPPGSDAGAGHRPPPPPPDPAGGSGFSARASAAARAAVTNGPLLLARATGWLVALWFLAAMAVGVAFWVTGALRVHLPALPIGAGLAAVGVLGVTLVRSRRIGAVIAAMALLLVPATVAAALTRVDGQAGDRSVFPMTASDLEREYRHSVGSIDLDLSALPLPPGSRTPIDLSMGVGRIEVIVPWDAAVEARASVGFGSFDLFGNRQAGVNLDGRTRSAGRPGAAVIDLRGEVGGGEVIVRRGDASAREPGATTTPTTTTPTTTPTTTTTVPVVPGAPPGEYRCTIPEGGGPATCVPA